MSGPALPPLRRSAARLGTAVVRIACPDCGRELASASYGARELLELHEPTCSGPSVSDRVGAAEGGDGSAVPD